MRVRSALLLYALLAVYCLLCLLCSTPLYIVRFLGLSLSLCLLSFLLIFVFTACAKPTLLADFETVFPKADELEW
jgi:hypothetical protein